MITMTYNGKTAQAQITDEVCAKSSLARNEVLMRRNSAQDVAGDSLISPVVSSTTSARKI